MTYPIGEGKKLWSIGRDRDPPLETQSGQILLNIFGYLLHIFSHLQHNLRN